MLTACLLACSRGGGGGGGAAAAAAALNEFCHSYLYSRGTDMHHSKHTSRALSNQFTGASVGSTENTASSIVCGIVFTELFPGNVLIKSVTILLYNRQHNKFAINKPILLY
jgi:hypothetical protein